MQVTEAAMKMTFMQSFTTLFQVGASLTLSRLKNG